MEFNRKLTPEDGGVQRIPINSSVRGLKDLSADLFPYEEIADEDQSETFESFIDTIEDLELLQKELSLKFKEVDDSRIAVGPESNTRVSEDLYTSIRELHNAINDTFRAQKDFVTAGSEAAIEENGALLGQQITEFFALKEALDEELALEEAPAEHVVVEETALVDKNTETLASLVEQFTDTKKHSEALREQWVEAKKHHDALQQEYKVQVDQFYGKFWNRAKNSLGFSPELPEEILLLKEDMYAATAIYNEASAAMIEERKKLAGDSPEAQKILDRHSKMFARTLLLRNFDEQIDAQKRGVFRTNPAVAEFMKNHGKKLRLAGAVTVGAATGGLFAPAWAGARSLAGAAVTGAAVKFVGDRADAEVAKERGEFEAHYKTEVEDLVAFIRNKGVLSRDELMEIDTRLNELYKKVDKATALRIRKVVLTAVGTGLLFGSASAAAAEALVDVPLAGGVAEVETQAPPVAVENNVDLNESVREVPDSFGEQSDEITPEEAERIRAEGWATARSYDGQAGVEAPPAESALPQDDIIERRDSILATATERVASGATLNEAWAVEGAPPAAENNTGTGSTWNEVVENATTPAESEVSAVSDSSYEVQSGDNVWDILEGQTAAGEFEALEGLSEAEEQQAIAAVVERLNGSAELREQFGMGDTADMLYAGETIDKEALNALIQEELSPEAGAENVEASAAEASGAGTSEAGVPPEVSPNDETSSSADTYNGAETSDSEVDSSPVGESAFAVAALAGSLGIIASASPNEIHKFARGYPGGYTKFESDLSKNFIEKIQGPDPSPGFLGRLFGAVPKKSNAYLQLAHLTVGEIREFSAVGNESSRDAFLTEHNITKEDFGAWVDSLNAWKQTKLVRFSSRTRFDDAVKAAYIEQLSNPTSTT